MGKVGASGRSEHKTKADGSSSKAGSKSASSSKKGFLSKATKSKSTVDFKHLKGKVGKRLAKPLSHTDTSFKSKRVSVAAQSILVDRDGGDVASARGKTIAELRGQLNHYAPNVQREALLGFKSLVQLNPGVALHRFSALSEATLESIVSIENTVRSALLEYQELLLSCVDESTVGPFADLYTAYICAALASLDRDIRKDGLSFLGLLLARFPGLVAARLHKLLPAYPPLLASDPTATRQTTRSAAAVSLLSLLNASLANTKSIHSINSQNRSICTSTQGGSIWSNNTYANATLMTWTWASESQGETNISNTGQGVNTCIETLPLLLPLFLEIWVESASGEKNITQAQVVVDILLALLKHPQFGYSTNDEIDKEDKNVYKSDLAVWLVKTFLPLAMGEEHGESVFPLKASAGSLQGEGATAVISGLNTLNASLCELAVTAAKAGTLHDSPYVTAALDHVRATLESGARAALDGGGGGMGAGALARPLSVLYAAARPGSFVEGSHELLSTFGQLLSALHWASDAKAACARFACQWAQDSATIMTSATQEEPSSENVPEEPKNVLSGFSIACDWLKGMAPLLPQWAVGRPELAEELLAALLEVAKRLPVVQTEDNKVNKTSNELQKSAVLLCTNLVSEGITGLLTEKAWIALPPGARRTTCALLYHLPYPGGEELSALLEAAAKLCGSDLEGSEGVLEAVHMRRKRLSPAAYLGFLVEVLKGGREASADTSPWDIACGRDRCTEHVCACISDLGGRTKGPALIQSLTPHILPLLSTNTTYDDNTSVRGPLPNVSPTCVRDFRIACGVILTCMKCCVHTDGEIAMKNAITPILEVLAHACVRMLCHTLPSDANAYTHMGTSMNYVSGENSIKLDEAHAPIVCLLEYIHMLLPNLLNVCVDVIKAYVQENQTRSAEPLILRLQFLMRMHPNVIAKSVSAHDTHINSDFMKCIENICSMLESTPLAGAGVQLLTDGKLVAQVAKSALKESASAQ